MLGRISTKNDGPFMLPPDTVFVPHSYKHTSRDLLPKLKASSEVISKHPVQSGNL